MVGTITYKFSLGKTLATREVADSIGSSEIQSFLSRHHQGDWGDLCDEDRNANEEALKVGSRFLSVYHSKAGEKVYVITEADRSVTIVLFPEEY